MGRPSLLHSVVGLSLVVLAGCGGNGNVSAPNYSFQVRPAFPENFLVTDFLSTSPNSVVAITSGSLLESSVVYTFGGTEETISFPGGSQTLRIVDANSSGTYVGSIVRSGHRVSVIGSGGAAEIDTGGLTPLANDDITFDGINDSGAVVGMQVPRTENIFVRSPGGVCTYYALPSGLAVDSIQGLTNSGIVYGQTKTFRTFVIADGEVTVQDNGIYYDANNHDVAVGAVGLTAFKVKLPNGARTPLPVPEGTTTSLALGINDTGDIVGMFVIGGVWHPCLWQAKSGRLVDLLPFISVPIGYDTFAATGIDNSGNILISFSETATQGATSGLLTSISE